MADSDASEELFALWRKQVEASTEAWSKAVEQMSSQGQGSTTPPDAAQFWQQFMDPGAAAWARFQSAGPVDPQTLGQWKRFLDDWIEAWSKALEKAMGTEAFAEALGKTLDQFLSVQGQAKEAAEKSSKVALDTLGLPSRDQVVGLSRQLMDLEDRLEALEDKLEAAGAAPPRPKPRARATTTKASTSKPRARAKPTSAPTAKPRARAATKTTSRKTAKKRAGKKS